MNAFKVYLPSNACPVEFPNNTSTNYRTTFKNPITLDGTWEVGVANISYSPFINDEKEQAQIDYQIKMKKEVTVNSIYPYQFKLNDGKWKGHSGVPPLHHLPEGENIEGLLLLLKWLQESLLDEVSVGRYQNLPYIFYLSNDKVTYKAFDPSLNVQITNKLAAVLGFGQQTIFTGNGTFVADEKRSTMKNLTLSDCTIWFMNTNITKLKKRIYLKRRDERFHKKEYFFQKLWKEKVLSEINVKVEFDDHKLVVRSEEPELAMIFSPDFAKTFSLPNSFIGKVSCLATKPYEYAYEQVMEDWYIDVYSSELETTKVSEIKTLSLKLFPWHYKTVKQLVRAINSKTETLLKDELQDYYDQKAHKFVLSLDENYYCHLTKGRWTKTRFGKNLSFLLSLPNEYVATTSLISTQEVNSLSNHSRQLHVITNVIRPTCYGENQREILCDFLHTANPNAVVEKRFDPVSYHTVARNCINMIHIQLTNDEYQPITIKDAATLVTLFFRKVK